MKKISRTMTHAESTRRRRLQLSKEAIRTLRADDLAAVNGQAACNTTSFTTEKKTDGTVTSKS
jgi:hypothetical protein